MSNEFESNQNKYGQLHLVSIHIKWYHMNYVEKGGILSYQQLKLNRQENNGN